MHAILWCDICDIVGWTLFYEHYFLWILLFSQFFKKNKAWGQAIDHKLMKPWHCELFKIQENWCPQILMIPQYHEAKCEDAKAPNLLHCLKV